MNYMYAAMFIIAGLILIFQLSKENKIFYLAGAYFVVMGAWWGVDAFKPDWSVFTGVPGIIFKVITGIVLVICAVMFFKLNAAERKKEKAKNKADSEKKGS
ncbi:MAG: hypothetical protein J6I98_02200 [Clostridia bacterium]|nr:hypothetical protein [Clostridia bacterium]